MAVFLQPESSPLRKSGAGSIGNWSIAISRRYNNIIRDNDRQAQIEMFLGMNTDKHFLTCYSPLGTEASGPLPYISPKNLPTDFPDTDDDSDPISHMSYPSTLNLTRSNHSEHAADAIPHSHSNSDLMEAGKQCGMIDEQLLPQRSLSESNLAGGLEFDRMLAKEMSFTRWGNVPSSPIREEEMHRVDAPQGLREVPVDISPLELS